ncbi:hypothetical protein VNO80_29677 [Phaseolus coccineus]|uniref:Uncharacterized protein n=1 Tax=Phaseolus coccineus TaxID=3886 RepID=A0AAN9LBD7_PHACN
MRTLGHLMFPFAYLPMASGGWTVSWFGVLRTLSCGGLGRSQSHARDPLYLCNAWTLWHTWGDNSLGCGTCSELRFSDLCSSEKSILPVALMIPDNSSNCMTLVPVKYHSNLCPLNFRWYDSGLPWWRQVTKN